MFSLGCGIERELLYLDFLNMISARQVLDTLAILAELEHAESLSVTSKGKKEGRKKSRHQALFEMKYKVT